MRRLAAAAAATAAAIAVAACSAPANNPCLYDGGLAYTHLSYSGTTLLATCKDGKIIVSHP